jgi:hypothetical protein
VKIEHDVKRLFPVNCVAKIGIAEKHLQQWSKITFFAHSAHQSPKNIGDDEPGSPAFRVSVLDIETVINCAKVVNKSPDICKKSHRYELGDLNYKNPGT